MKKFIFLFIILGIVSCKSTKQTSAGTVETTPRDLYVVENLAGMNSENIKKHYSEATINEDIGMFDEGTEERPYTTLYPGTADEIQITWADAGRTKIYDIRFTEEGRWRSNTGIKVGTTYKELNRLNGKEISFYGFGWDYSGAVMWNDGKLEESNIFVFLEPGKPLPDHFYGDHLIKASPEEIAALELKVSTILYKS